MADGHHHGHAATGHSHSHSHSHTHTHTHSQAPGGRDWAEFGARLEREGELVRPIHDALIARVRHALDGRDVRRILDLGSGPGVATTLLAEAFPSAHATAVDASPPLLALAVARADRLGVADRVDTATADLELPLGALAEPGSVDVVWASMVLHHVGDPSGTLGEIRRLLAPGGVLALVEFGDDRRTLPAGSIPERPGFVERHSEVLLDALEAHLPPGALAIDWPETLAAAGFELLAHEMEVLAIDAPLGEAERAFVAQSLEVSTRLGLRRLDDLDLLTLARLLDPVHPRSVWRRDDLPLRISRTVVVARRL